MSSSLATGRAKKKKPTTRCTGKRCKSGDLWEQKLDFSFLLPSIVKWILGWSIYFKSQKYFNTHPLDRNNELLKIHEYRHLWIMAMASRKCLTNERHTIKYWWKYVTKMEPMPQIGTVLKNHQSSSFRLSCPASHVFFLSILPPVFPCKEYWENFLLISKTTHLQIYFQAVQFNHMQ